MPSIEDLKARCDEYDAQAAAAEPFVPDKLKAKQQAAHETLDQAVDDAAVNLKDLEANARATRSEAEATTERTLKLMRAMIKQTDKLFEARERAAAAARLARAAGVLAPSPNPIHARQDYETRKLLADYLASTRRPL